MLTLIVQGPTYQDLKKQIAEAALVADCIEIRLDLLETVHSTSLQEALLGYTIPFIFTLRSEAEGGGFNGTIEAQMETIISLLALQPHYVDLEFRLPSSFILRVAKTFPDIKIIVSYHDFAGTCNMATQYARMKSTPAAFYKIAKMCHSSLDALQCLLFAMENKESLIVIGMGPFGQITRIALPIFGIPLTYAPLSESAVSAPGQLAADILLDRYHFREINEQTALFGLIGNPVEQSISDVTHNEYFKNNKIRGVYVKMKVTPSELQEFLFLCKKLPFRGLSVTMPLKEVIMPYLDAIDDKAKKIGAVNTLLFEKGKITGFNTDCIGALEAIETKQKVAGKKVVILGAGGAAKAIAYEALLRGASVVVVNRDKKRAETSAHELKCLARGIEEMEAVAYEGYDILVNATPSPMPISSTYILSNALVMDIKTKPKETEFLLAAAKKGCEIVYGIEMFFSQAKGQFAIWQ